MTESKIYERATFGVVDHLKSKGLWKILTKGKTELELNDEMVEIKEMFDRAIPD
ncbi:hypothetical protein HQ571_03420 [Candidatus Kuenenbacteria bacterium]|nr:hypothetical protein [Candidatus Kuenenbacteria bacterium]